MTRAVLLVALVAASACMRRPVLPTPGIAVDVRVRVGRAALEGVEAHPCTCCRTPPPGPTCVCSARGIAP